MTSARIAQLRESIARRALAAVGAPSSVRILDVRRIGTVFVVATEDPSCRWFSYSVETFRIPTSDGTDRNYEPGRAPKVWGALAGWISDDPREVPALLARAADYACRHQVI